MKKFPPFEEGQVREVTFVEMGYIKYVLILVYKTVKPLQKPEFHMQAFELKKLFGCVKFFIANPKDINYPEDLHLPNRNY